MLTRFSWEPLEEAAPEGQWNYFERLTHTGTTQKS
jgi:NADH dehydrogenase (ubiquinone) 1 alpha subcomplex subunit 5